MLASTIQITDQDARSLSSTQGGEKLGQLAITPGGRVYAYSRNGAVDLAAGKVTATPAVVANHINRTGVVYSIGTQQVVFAVGATAVTADQYRDGLFVVNVGPGQNAYSVSGNTAANSSGSPTVTLSDPLTIATTTSSKFSLYKSWQADVVVAPSGTGVSQQVAGVPNVLVTAGYYFWNQVGGYCAVLSDGVIAKNAGAIASDAVDGALETEAAGTVTQRVGYAPEATVDTEYRPVCLTLRG